MADGWMNERMDQQTDLEIQSISDSKIDELLCTNLVWVVDQVGRVTQVLTEQLHSARHSTTYSTCGHLHRNQQ